MLSVMLFENARSSIKNLGNAATGQWLAKKKLFKLNSTPGSAEDLAAVMEAAGVTPPGRHQRNHSATSLGISSNHSVSLHSISSEGSADSHLVEQEDIVALTHDVRAFKEALGKLRRIFHPDKDKQETLRVAAHERLGEVLRILRTVLERYAPLQSTELFMAAGALIQQVKQHGYEDERADPTEFFESIDQLALAFSSRVSEYLMGDLDSSSTVLTSSSSKAKSCENLASDTESATVESRDETGASSQLTPQQLDATLHRLDQGVEVALHRAKVWSKYAKDVLTYVEKRTGLEMEYAKNAAKLAQTMRCALKEDSFLPFQSIYCTALDQDLENSANIQNTCSLLQGHKFIEPLGARRNEHERSRKQIKELWHRELKRMHETVANLRKAKMIYIQRQQEYERAKEVALRAEAGEQTEASRTEKKRRLEEDALEKAQQAEVYYRECVREANERHAALQKVKGEVLTQVRELTLQCDQTMKAVTASYFQLQHTATAPMPVQFQTLCESSRLYEPGSQYTEFVKRLLPAARSQRDVSAPGSAAPPPAAAIGSGPFMFEPYGPEEPAPARDRKSNDSGGGNARPTKPWPPSVQPASDTDSVGSSTKSVDTSPTASPMAAERRLAAASSGDELETEQETDGYVTRRAMSKAAVTHHFRKLITPSRCRECDSYVYFQGLECTECGLTSHKKCVETLAIQCGHKRLPRKMTTFGVDLSQHLAETCAPIPHLVCKCVAEIDHRGCGIKGIYRVSGVKSRVEKLCQAFENGAHLVDLTDVHPNVIANVLKLYLRQLPEPLLCFRLYSDFIRIAKDHPTNDCDVPSAVRELQAVVKRLPRPHHTTLAFLMHHLQRVSRGANTNNMPPSNLGIVFGPTLLRTAEGSASLSSLVDTVHQTRVIELLVSHVQEIFGPEELVTPADYPHMYRAVVRRATSRIQERRSREETTPAADELQPPAGDSSPNGEQAAGAGGRPRSLIYRGSLRDYMGLECASVSSISSSLEKSGGEERLTSQESDDAEPPAAVAAAAAVTVTQQDKPAIVKMCLKSYIGLESFQSQSSPSLLAPPDAGVAHPKLRKSISDNSGSGAVSPVDGGVYMGGEVGAAGGGGGGGTPPPSTSTRRRPPSAAQSLPEPAASPAASTSNRRPHRPLGRVAGELVRGERVSSMDVPPDEPAAPAACPAPAPLSKLSGEYVSPYAVGGSARVKYPHYGGRTSRSASQSSVAPSQADRPEPAHTAPPAAAARGAVSKSDGQVAPAAVLVTLPAPQRAVVVPAAQTAPEQGPTAAEAATEPTPAPPAAPGGPTETVSERLTSQTATVSAARQVPATAVRPPGAPTSHSDEAGSSERFERFV
ncbi:rho GTPase-activating protein 45-like isoform X3 [Amphibalanus amphitrite]|uniref:rho GTPase-activating protein 45-like isoform X3 n=1 Tax=Amphibalanus amphitrite TaxID=1232801 RepID=UPI001C907036|nr:rho GTPase-activating protein 45-like isoform X3 [Amphibalanus amphitrite]